MVKKKNARALCTIMLNTESKKLRETELYLKPNSGIVNMLYGYYTTPGAKRALFK